MAHESFEDQKVADLLNSHFISIKVDREERPDIDAVYMQVCQAMTGSGGWPLNVFLTPDQHPFFAGTYFPKTAGYGQPGFVDILQAIANKWEKSPQSLIENGREITAAFASSASPAAGKMNKELLRRARTVLADRFDDDYGGFSAAPKFPTPHVLMFLLRYAMLEDDRNALHMVEKTLAQMYRGGIFDHIGGGFSRYSTERKWLIPHFEKMLYDNALLAISYTEAYAITGKPLYWRVATRTLDYLTREMQSPEGGFFSAQDADTGGQEGAYYTFTPAEITNVLGEAEGQRVNRMYGVTQSGVLEGKSILNRLGESQEEEEKLQPLMQKLYSWRKQNRNLFTDDKVLAEWNGYAIAAFAKAAYALHKPEHLQTAKKAMAFVQNNLLDENGLLYAHWRQGKKGGQGSLSDYAAIIWASLSLYQATFDFAYVKQAETLAHAMVKLFFDDKLGDFFLNDPDAGLIFRPKEHYDGAVPSGNSLAAYVLNQLGLLTGNDAWLEYAVRTLERLAGAAQSQPAGYCFALTAGISRCYLPTEAVCIAGDQKYIDAFAIAAGRRFLPYAVFAARHTDTKEKDAPGIVKGRDTMGHPAAYYFCEKGACRPPVFTLNEMESLLQKAGAAPGKTGGA